MTTKWLPPATFAPVSLGNAASRAAPAPRRTINEAASPASERQATLAAENAPIRITYGRDRIGAQVANVLSHAGYWLVVCVWGEGEIDAIESISFSDKPPPASVQFAHYTGAPGQTVNAWLVDAFAAQDIAYADALPGIAYSVIRIPSSVEGWENITATIRGRKLYDPRSGLAEYSSNPALALADFLSSDIYGCGWPVDWDSVEIAAEACDEIVGGAPRRAVGVTLETVMQVEQWIETLRTYAGCLRPVLGPNGWRLIVDGVASVSRAIDHAAGQILDISPIKKRGNSDAPTVVRVIWTDATATPWRDREAVARLPGVLAGTTPRREQEIRLPGVQKYAQAMREAVERLNKLTLADISCEIEVFDDALSVEIGDVVSVTHPVGLSAKQMRVLDVTGDAGRYRLVLSEYDPASYSDAVLTEPTSPDTSLPSPSAPTAVTSLALAEEVYQQQDGTFSSRIYATWVDDFPFVDHYRVNVISGGETIHTGTSRTVGYRTPAIQEGVSYQVDVVSLSSIGSASPSASATITALGKQLPPGNVPSLDGFEVGGEVRLRWAAAIDIDIWRYEIRYVAVAGSWDDGVLIDRIDALTLVSNVVPVGEWDLMVKAVDSVGNYSPAEARRTLTVTLDDGAYLADTYDYDTPALTAMHEYRLGRLDQARRFVTTSAASWNSVFGSAMSGYSNPVLSYFAATSAFVTETHDYGLMLAGNWQSELTITNLSGAHTRQMELSADGSSWDDYPSLVAKTSARFSRLRAETTGVMLAELPLARTRIDAIPRTESGSGTSAASGGTAVTLANEYAAAKSIVVTPMGTAARICVVDNVVMGAPSSFDVYVFDAAGNQVAGGFMWSFEGV